MDQSYRVSESPTLAEKAAQMLRKLIQRDYVNGGQIPGEIGLAEMLGVNRNTVRQALKTLELEGLVIRRRGAGTYANQHILANKMRLDKLRRYRDSIRMAGKEPGRRVLGWGTIRATEDLAAQLEIDPFSLLLRSEALITADGVPAIAVESFIPMKFLNNQNTLLENPMPTFDLIEMYSQERINHSIIEILPELCCDEVAEYFALEPGAPLIKLMSVHFSDRNHPIMRTISLINDNVIRFSTFAKKEY